MREKLANFEPAQAVAAVWSTAAAVGRGARFVPACAAPGDRLEPDRDPVQERHPGEPLEVLGIRGGEQVDVGAAGGVARSSSRRGVPSRAGPRSCRA